MFGADRFKYKQTPESVRDILGKAEEESPNSIKKAETSRRLQQRPRSASYAGLDSLRAVLRFSPTFVLQL